MFICALFFLSACATSPQKAQWNHDASQPVTCSKGSDCEAKWGRALTWVKSHSKYGIKIASETIISTEVSHTWNDAVFSITKVKADDETYTIVFRAGCNSILAATTLGCSPSVLELKASFVNFVMKPDDSSATSGASTPAAQKNKDIGKPKVDLGIVTAKTSPAAANRLGMKEPKGARIVYVGPDSVAFDSGLQQEDVILKYGEKIIEDVPDINAAIEETAPHKIVPITIWRAGTGEMVIPVQF